MSMLDGEEAGGFSQKLKGGAKKVGIAAAALLALGVGKIAIPAMVGGAAALGGHAVAEEAMAGMNEQKMSDFALSHEVYGSSFRAMKSNFPAEFNELMSNAVRAPDPSAYSFNMMKQFRIKKGAMMAQAPADQVYAVFAKENGLIHWLADRSVTACADMAFGTATSSQGMPDGAINEFAGLLPVFMEAAGAGDRAPAGRDYANVDQSVMERWVQKIEQSDLSDELYYGMMEGREAEFSSSDRCKMGLALYQSIGQLSKDDAVYVYGMLNHEGAATVN